jgi:hypothetical protein
VFASAPTARPSLAGFAGSSSLLRSTKQSFVFASAPTARPSLASVSSGGTRFCLERGERFDAARTYQV